MAETSSSSPWICLREMIFPGLEVKIKQSGGLRIFLMVGILFHSIHTVPWPG